MNKFIIILLLFANFLVAINKDNVYKKLSLDSVWEIKTIIKKDEAITILPFKTDTKQRFRQSLTHELSNYFDILEIESLDTTKQLLKMGNQDWFDETKAAQMGKLVPAKWAITGAVKVISKSILFKKKYTLQTDLKIYHLKTGSLKHSIRLKSTDITKIPKYIYAMVISILFLLALIANRIAKNYYSNLVFLAWILISILWSAWFWLI